MTKNVDLQTLWLINHLVTIEVHVLLNMTSLGTQITFKKYIDLHATEV